MRVDGKWMVSVSGVVGVAGFAEVIELVRGYRSETLDGRKEARESACLGFTDRRK